MESVLPNFSLPFHFWCDIFAAKELDWTDTSTAPKHMQQINMIWFELNWIDAYLQNKGFIYNAVCIPLYY